jgi:hypothetical protein
MSIRHRWRLVATVAVGLAALATAGACGASESSHSSSADSGGNKAAAPALGGAAQDNAGAGPVDAGKAPDQVPDKLPDTRSIIYTGTMTVRVTKVDDAAARATAVATAAGGFVGGDQRKSDATSSTAQLTLRVPSAKFDDVIGQLHNLGKELDRALSSQDVTADVADVNARIANAQASVTRVRALMDKAQTITDITTLEAELSRREGDLESLQARQRSLTDQTSLSTITLSLLSPDTPAPVAAPHKTKIGFLAGLEAGWTAFVGFIVVVVTVLGALLPWIVVAALVGFLPWRRWRRRRAERLVLAPAGMPVPASGPPSPLHGPPPGAPAPTAPVSGPRTGPARAAEQAERGGPRPPAAPVPTWSSPGVEPGTAPPAARPVSPAAPTELPERPAESD